jgi:phage major head subunit gpT-like protein
MAFTSGAFPRLLDKRLREVFSDKFKSLPSMIPSLYRTMDSQGAFEEFYEVGALPDIPEFNGKLEYLNAAPGYYNKIEPKEFAGGVMFERKLIDDKQYSVFDNRAGLLAESAARVREKYGVRPFAYAFSSAYDFQTSEEGVALCSTAHTTKSGVSTASGFSNAGTSALDKTSVAATRLLMRKFKSELGERIDIEPDTLIVPDNLADKAMEIVGTDKGLYSAEGTVNVQKGRFKVIPYLRLDDYDTNNWFMASSSMMKRFLVWIDRIKPDNANTVDFETYYVKFSTYFRMANGFLDWRWIYGHNVT